MAMGDSSKPVCDSGIDGAGDSQGLAIGGYMMRNESDAILDDLLSRWHSWAKGFQVCPAPSADPMFRGVKSGRAWETQYEIAEAQLNDDTMEAIDFQVGEMAEPNRSAIYANARNLASRYAVWTSPRLPTDPQERAIVVMGARTDLMRRLLRAGIM